MTTNNPNDAVNAAAYIADAREMINQKYLDMLRAHKLPDTYENFKFIILSCVLPLVQRHLCMDEVADVFKEIMEDVTDFRGVSTQEPS